MTFSGGRFRGIFGVLRGTGEGAHLLPARQFKAAAAITLLLIATVCFVPDSAWAAQRHKAQGPAKQAAQHQAPAEKQAEVPLDNCKVETGLAMLASPAAPWKGTPLKVIFAVEKPANGELTLTAPDGNRKCSRCCVKKC